MPDHSDDTSLIEDPFPLKERFQRRFIPGLLGFVVVFLLIIGVTAKQAVESIYLELAQKRAQTIARSVSEEAKDAWRALMAGKSISELNEKADARLLTAAFAAEVRQLDLLELKVYDLNRRVLYATHAKEIGTTENGVALREVIRSNEAGLVTKTLADGSQQYELYVPVFDDAGRLRTVFELYEPVNYLDAILTRSAIPIIAIPGMLFVLLAITLNRLVNFAQLDINNRTTAINDLRKRLESFVSSTAVNAAKRSAPGDVIASQKLTTTLFFSDIRDFTGFAEQNTPEDVVSFLNRLMTLQVEILKRHGGDIDKMIGDAVLARFDKDDDAKHAIAASREIQRVIAKGGYARAIGIGIYRGAVISGAIGPEDRRDFTVIGDSVNIASRLCSAAAGGEIVVDAGLADDDFGPEESITVKGRKTAVSIRRIKTTVSR